MITIARLATAISLAIERDRVTRADKGNIIYKSNKFVGYIYLIFITVYRGRPTLRATAAVVKFHCLDDGGKILPADALVYRRYDHLRFNWRKNRR